MPRGKAELETAFSIDANGILTVTAKDKATGRKSNIEIRNDAGRLSAAEIERMLEDAKKSAAEDKAKREALEARSELEMYLNQVQDSLFTPQVAAKVNVPAIEELIGEGLAWLEDNTAAAKGDVSGYQRKIERQIQQHMSKLYAKGGKKK